MKRLARLCLSILLAPALAAADPVRLSDFAYAAGIVTEGEGPVYRLDLVPAVYMGLTRPDLADLRVFNAAGEPVPQTTILPEGVRAQNRPETQEGLDLPLFPLPSETERLLPALRLRIEQGGDSQSIAMETQGAGEADGAQYILDARRAKGPLERFVVRWEGPTFLARLDLDASDDLEHWSQVATGATLADLKHLGQHLVRDEVRVPPTAARYFRIRFDRPPKGVSLKGVRAHVAGPASEPVRSEMDLETVAGPGPGEYRFRIPAGLALDGLGIRLPEINTLVGASLESRPTTDDPWSLRLRTTLYRVRQGGVDLENPDLELGARPDRFWRLRIDQDSGGIGTGSPKLRAVYRAHELRFLARGEGPYTLAWGSARPMPVSMTGSDRFLRGAEVRPLPAHISGPPRRSADAGALTPPFPWRTWLLWAALAGGSLLLVWMAVRLLRQMNPPA